MADLVVLDHNLFDIDPHDIHKAKVLLTIMNGKVVYGGMNATSDQGVPGSDRLCSEYYLSRPNLGMA